MLDKTYTDDNGEIKGYCYAGVQVAIVEENRCEHGIGTESHCTKRAGYWSYDAKRYSCKDHAEQFYLMNKDLKGGQQ